jgi:hypothetical protein
LCLLSILPLLILFSVYCSPTPSAFGKRLEDLCEALKRNQREDQDTEERPKYRIKTKTKTETLSTTTSLSTAIRPASSF